MFPDISRDDIFRLETPRLWLRWLRAADAAAITAIAGLAEVATMVSAIPHPYPAGEAERFILHSRASNAAGTALVLAVTTKSRGQMLVGLASVQDGESGTYELGYVVAPSFAGRGYASEAVRAVVDAVFNLTQARAVVADSRTINPASRRVLEKCGFGFIGMALKNLPARGGQHPCDFFRLDRRDWLAGQGAPRRLPGMVQQGPRVAPAAGGAEQPQ